MSEEVMIRRSILVLMLSVLMLLPVVGDQTQVENEPTETAKGSGTSQTDTQTHTHAAKKPAKAKQEGTCKTDNKKTTESRLTVLGKKLSQVSKQDYCTGCEITSDFMVFYVLAQEEMTKRDSFQVSVDPDLSVERVCNGRLFEGLRPDLRTVCEYLLRAHNHDGFGYLLTMPSDFRVHLAHKRKFCNKIKACTARKKQPVFKKRCERCEVVVRDLEKLLSSYDLETDTEMRITLLVDYWNRGLGLRFDRLDGLEEVVSEFTEEKDAWKKLSKQLVTKDIDLVEKLCYSWSKYSSDNFCRKKNKKSKTSAIN